MPGSLKRAKKKGLPQQAKELRILSKQIRENMEVDRELGQFELKIFIERMRERKNYYNSREMKKKKTKINKN